MAILKTVLNTLHIWLPLYNKIYSTKYLVSIETKVTNMEMMFQSFDESQ